MNSAANPCWHCGAPVRGRPFRARTPDGERDTCCGGCTAAVESIHQLGLGDYYRFRTEAADTPDVEQDDSLNLSLFDLPELVAPFLRQENERDILTLRIDGLKCAACVWLIERALGSMEGVENVRLNLASGRLQVTYLRGSQTPAAIARRLHGLGYSAHLPTRDARLQYARDAHRLMLRRLLVAGLCSMQAMMYSTALYIGTFEGSDAVYQDLFRLVTFMVATPAVFYSGWPFFSGAWYSIKARTLTMDVPVALALGLAWAGSVVALVLGEGHIYFESLAMFVFFLLISRYLEQRQRLRVAESHSRLADTVPTVARRRTSDSWQTVAAHQVQPGDVLLVQQGEPVPADGEMLDGEALLEEALLTGEAKPRQRIAGDVLRAGSRVLEGQLEMRATAVVSDSMVARLGRLLDDSADRQARLHLYAKAVVPWFILGVLCLAAFTLYWHREAGIGQGLQYALAVLVVTCPCALALAAPLAVSAAQHRALRQGVLVANPLQLLGLKNIDTLMFDKTGTLTLGQFSVVETTLLDESLDQSELLGIAAGLEQRASHPLADAIAALAEPLPIKDFRQQRAGVGGQFGGHHWALRAAAPTLVARVANTDKQHTHVALYRDDQPVLLFVLADQQRADAEESLTQLRQQKHGLLLASGDEAGPVGALAKSLGIADWRAGLSPEDKLQWLSALQASGKRVLMSGDGVNDALALSKADASLAMADSAALARDAAGFYLLRPRLLNLPWLFGLSRQSNRILKQNIGWALGYNLLAIPFAVAGLIPPWLAAIGMSASSLIVTANASRLARWKS